MRSPSSSQPSSSQPDARASRRVLDIALAVAALVLSAPMALLAAVAIRCESPGPVLVRTTCLGRDRRRRGGPGRGARRLHDAGGELFVLLSFRTTRSPPGAPGAGPRPTWTGRLLTASGLDLLPGLLAVISGRLSLVGPRPLPARWAVRLAEVVPELSVALHGCRPGLFGPGPGSAPAGASLDAALVAALARRVLVDLPWFARRRRSRGALGALSADVASLLRVPGSGGSAARRRSEEQSGCPLTALWCDGLHLFDPWEAVVVKDLQPAPGPDEVLGIEMPASLDGLERACEQMMPVWRALAWREERSDLPARLTVAVLETAGHLAARAGSRDDRISVTTTIGARGVRLCARLQPRGASASSFAPALSLARLAEGLGPRGGPVAPA